MDRLENHIITLEQKIDRLYAVVEHLTQRLDESMQISEQISTHSHQWTTQESVGENPDPHHRGCNAMMGHKDVLLDDDTNTSRTTASDGEEVSPEIQIRRLNTQLTAAYNRIAALEEQLLAQRIHF
jgi:predicted nuclease with TOPRIM domain